MKTLYITDLDGTLLTNKGGLKDRAAEMIRRFGKKGILFTYATARRFISAERIMEKAEISLPVITMNGVVIADGKSGEVIKLNGFSENCLDEAKRVIAEKGETPIVHAIIEGEQRASYLEARTERMKNYLKLRKGDKTLRPCKSYEELFQGDIHYLTLINPILTETERRELFSEEMGFAYTCYFDTYYKEDLWFEVFSKNAGKANAALQLKEMLGADELAVFGDNLNDMTMFKASDRCYAVKNAAEELKAAATAIIGSNESVSVPRLVEKEQTEVFAYSPRETVTTEPNGEKFALAVEKALGREKAGIGTLNEKNIHAALKNYYSEEYDQEARIGSFYADIIGENGIIEIQSANWGKLNKKLDVMLDACHVTAVYPFEKRVKAVSADDVTGEILREGNWRNLKDLTKFFLELYRIKSFLTNPNLTVAIAELETERINYVSSKTGKRRKKGSYSKTPKALLREIHLEKPEDYLELLPSGIEKQLPAEFSVKELQALIKPTDAKLTLEIFGYLGLTEKCGKRGNAELYRFCGSE
ncbi:MAG: HAD family hydrolase [Firmicutes bacterium]|nr:HAD family hydrolase [[Eubacterium] siraeum]MCM1487462.1 HAD family hydrolase [Bacillota bacterium]